MRFLQPNMTEMTRFIDQKLKIKPYKTLCWSPFFTSPQNSLQKLFPATNATELQILLALEISQNLHLWLSLREKDIVLFSNIMLSSKLSIAVKIRQTFKMVKGISLSCAAENLKMPLKNLPPPELSATERCI